MKKFSFAVPGLCWALAATAAADPATNSPVESASSLIQEAFAHNAEMRYFEAEVEGAKAARRTAGLLRQPEISGSAGQKRSTDPIAALSGEGAAWSVSVSQTFDWPGRLGLRKAIANQDIVLAELGLGRFRAALAASIRGKVNALAAAQEQSRAAQTVADRFHALRETMIARDPAGIAPQLEVRVLEATELTIRRRAADAGLAASRARLELNLLSGRPPGQPLQTAPLPLAWTNAPDLVSLTAAAQTNNFELRLRAAELEQQGFRVRLARNERWPSFSVGPHYSEENAGTQDRIAGVSLSFPLPLWRNNASNVEAAKAKERQAQALLDAALRNVTTRIAGAAATYDAKRQEAAHWQPESVREFDQAAELADRHFRLGAVPATTYIELQRQYLDAVDTLLETQREAILAAAEIEELTGINLLGTP